MISIIVFHLYWILSSVYALNSCEQYVTRTCPVSYEEWNLRSMAYNCSDGKIYTCLPGPNRSHIEACMFDVKIPANSVGCPHIIVCESGNLHIGIPDNFRPCGTYNVGCPPERHDGYSAHQLYQYPACYQTEPTSQLISTTTKWSTADDSRHRTTKTDSDFWTYIPVESTTVTGFPDADINYVNYGLIVIVAILLILFIGISLVIFFYIRYKYKRQRNHEDVPEMRHLSGTRKYEEEQQSFLTETEDQTTVDATLPSSRELNTSSRSYLGEISNLMRNLQRHNRFESERIPVSSIRGNIKLPMDEIYASVSIRYDLERSSSLPFHNTRTEEDIIIQPRDIFYIKESPARFVFMLGEAARGKSAFCLRLLNHWCNAKEHGVKNDWERCLNEFDFLFLVKLRHVMKAQNDITDMICDDNFGHIPSLHGAVREVLGDDRYRCLILIDGLDEWKLSGNALSMLRNKGIPNARNISNSTILFTMRTWKFADVSEICRRDDRVVEILGLNQSGIRDLARNILKSYYKMDEVSAVFETKLNEILMKSMDPNYSSLIKVPLVAIVCIQIWKEDREVGHTITSFYLALVDLLIKRAIERGCMCPASQTHINLPAALHKNRSVVEYISFLLILGKVAYEDLLSEQTLLVFQKSDLEKQLGQMELQFSLDVGLLSECETHEIFNEINVSINFFHKMLQEMLAAIYIICEKNVEEFCQSLTNTQILLNLSNVLSFLSGLSTETACLISSQIVKVANEDEKIKLHRQTFHFKHNRIVHELYNLQLNCYREVRGGKTIKKFVQQNRGFRFSDIFLSNYDADTRTVRETADVLEFHANDIISLMLLCIPDNDISGITMKELSRFSRNSTSLEAIFIDGYQKGRCRMLSSDMNFSRLKRLSLMNIAFENDMVFGPQVEGSLDEEVELLGLFFIKSAYNRNMNIDYKLCSIYVLSHTREGHKLPSAEPPEKIPVVLQKFLLTLPKYICLTTLYTSYMDNKTDRDTLMSVLKTMCHIRRVSYYGSCLQHDCDSAYDFAILRAFSELQNLTMLVLGHINLEENNLPPIYELKNIEHMWLQRFKLSPQNWNLFVKSIKPRNCDFNIVLSDTNIDGYSLSIIECESSPFSLIRNEGKGWREYLVQKEI